MSDANMSLREMYEYGQTDAEFLCRAKEADTGTWVFGDEFVVNTDGVSPGEVTEVSNAHGFVKRNDIRAYEVDPLTFGGFTGVMSDAGRGIFEGDVLTIRRKSFKPLKLLVVRAGYWYEFVNEKENQRLLCPHILSARTLSDVTLHIIGNIHDNPELLNSIYNKEDNNHE